MNEEPQQRRQRRRCATTTRSNEEIHEKHKHAPWRNDVGTQARMCLKDAVPSRA